MRIVDVAVLYDLSGKRGAIAVIDRPRTPNEIPAGVATAPLPDIDTAIAGARSTTSTSRHDRRRPGGAAGRGALRACGGIDYESLDGDTTPAA